MAKNNHPAQWECDWIDANKQKYYRDSHHVRQVKKQIILRTSFSRGALMRSSFDIEETNQPRCSKRLVLRRQDGSAVAIALVNFTTRKNNTATMSYRLNFAGSPFSDIGDVFNRGFICPNDVSSAVTEIIKNEIGAYKPLYYLEYMPRTSAMQIEANFKIGDVSVTYLFMIGGTHQG